MPVLSSFTHHDTTCYGNTDKFYVILFILIVLFRGLRTNRGLLVYQPPIRSLFIVNYCFNIDIACHFTDRCYLSRIRFHAGTLSGHANAHRDGIRELNSLSFRTHRSSHVFPAFENLLIFQRLSYLSETWKFSIILCGIPVKIYGQSDRLNCTFGDVVTASGNCTMDTITTVWTVVENVRVASGAAELAIFTALLYWFFTSRFVGFVYIIHLRYVLAAGQRSQTKPFLTLFPLLLLLIHSK